VPKVEGNAIHQKTQIFLSETSFIAIRLFSRFRILWNPSVLIFNIVYRFRILWNILVYIFNTLCKFRILWNCLGVFLWRCDPTRVMASSFLMFLDHTRRRTTVGKTPLDERSTSRRDLYLTTHNTHNRQISMPPVGFEPTISAGERPQTYALEKLLVYNFQFFIYHVRVLIFNLSHF